MSSSPPPASDTTASAAKARRQRKLRRRVTGALVLMMGLVSAGFLASALTPTPQVATATDDQAALIREGKQLYDTSCITCHGANLQGVQDRGPSLIGVGEAAVYFQVSSGRMPASRNEAQVERKPVKFDAEQTDAIGAYVQANGGGPTVIRDENGEVAQSSLRGGDIGRGSELFRLNCASCHNFTGRGGALSSGKYAPVLDPASEQQIYTAMVTGPQNMPKFSDRQLTLEEKKDIIAYIKSSGETKQPGGYGLGGIGPASEGLAMWVIGIIAVVGAALWIGARS
ncbi:ubiquinol-cytochrome c reductase cytochrome c subunit [Rhodococcus opacus PD630]|uniref:Cytochrome bc1 complex cytochrome c subunit n=4 Tax=Rhodococcus TaxID=1827 RepID=A0A1B1K9U8_RHOOP|nr:MULTISPECIES: cytochrome c [Rhodococcus]ANS29346.1 Ubiquinol-cytochrome c reductase cytochrome c subunit [Rhodococcus opacus]EHI42425.1 ubiquinol-cytochrome c reductase cytochrome c subunit [Rhodococcus opacus PD630]KXX60376.1 cytochrome C [Rhodococcus sp. LB1]MBA8964158.1 ubiquinol-cytochrome c reductase cytochrome c subunit [Rhodococcus opacus]MBP2207880.1 ubiquinol-cytochrome c reductase cytochrome c subunit [Rhodococcus opacus]